MTTNEIIEQLRLVAEMREAFDDATGEFLYTDADIKVAEDAINATKEEKLNAIQDYKLSVNDEIERFKAKKAVQDANIKRATKKQEYLKGLQDSLLGGEKLKTDEYSFYYKKSTSVVVTNIDLIEDKYCRFEKKPDSKLIKEQIEMCNKREENFFGAELVTKNSLAVR